MHELVRRHPATPPATTAGDSQRGGAGRIACLGRRAAIIESSLPILRTYYRQGPRYLTLTHSFHTDWPTPESTRAAATRRAHAVGEDVVRDESHRHEVDVSHVADATFWDVMRVSRAPVIASHSAVRAVLTTGNMSD